MATARQTKKGNIKLTLTPQEVDVVRLVLASVGGSPDNSPRGFIDEVSEALSEVFDIKLFSMLPYYNLLEGNFYFKDYSCGAPDGGYAFGCDCEF
jgi:hypothetical protein